MSERSENFMNQIWEARNAGADTEEKLVSAILEITSKEIQFFTAQDGRVVLDKSDMLQLAEELNQ